MIMKVKRKVYDRLLELTVLVVAGTALCANAEVKTLVWNGEPGAEWNRTSQNWLDGETPTTWIDGSDARFVRDGDRAVVSEFFVVRQISVAPNVSVKPVLTGAASGVDTSTAPFDGERGLAWGTTFNSTSAWTVIWRDRRLSTIDEIVGGTVSYSTASATGRGYFYLYDSATDTATVQIQPDTYGNTQMIATDIKFRQNGNDIEAQAIGSGYMNERDPASPNYHDRVKLRAINAYPVKNLLASTKGGKLLFAAGGGFSRASGMTVGVRLDDGGTDTKDRPVEGQCQLDWDTYVPNDWTNIWKNRLLCNIKEISYAYFNAGSHDGRGYGWTYDPETDTATVQIQPDYASDTQMWGCNLMFRQNGNDIEVKVKNAYCYGNATVGTPDYHNIVIEHNNGTFRQARSLLATSGAGNLSTDYCGTNLNANTAMKVTDENATLIWENTRLGDLVAVEGTMSSTSGDLANESIAFTNDGMTATVQLQRLCQQQTESQNGLITYLDLEFTQVGADIYVRINRAGYRWYRNVATDPLVFPDTRLLTTGPGDSTYSTKPGMLTGYFKPMVLSARIDDISNAPNLNGGGLAFSGADMGTNTFAFAWPLSIGSKYMPIGFTGGAKAVFPESLTNKVATVSFSGATTLTLPEGAAFEADAVEIAAGATVVIDADIATLPVRIGTSKCLGAAELAAFSTSQGKDISQNSLGYLVPRKGMAIQLR